MTFKEAILKLSDDPRYRINLDTLSDEDKEKLFLAVFDQVETLFTNVGRK